MNESVKSLALNIEAFHFKGSQNLYHSEYLEQDIIWGSAHLYQQLLYHADLIPILNEKAVKKLLRAFNNENNANVRLRPLVKKHWLRFVLDEVRIPSGVRKLIIDIEKIQGIDFKVACFLNEKTQEIGKPNYSSEELEDFLKEYPRENGSGINLEQLLEKHWLSKRSNSEEYFINQYIDHYIAVKEHLDEIRFISAILNKRQYYPSIKAYRAKRIINKHRKYFPETPDVESLIQRRVLGYLGDSRYTIFLGNEIHKSAGEQIGLGLLQKYFPFMESIDKPAIIRWLRSLGEEELGIYHAAIKKIDPKRRARLLDEITDIIVTEPDFLDIKNELEKLRLDYYLSSNSIFLSRRVRSQLSGYTSPYQFFSALDKIDNYSQGLFRQQAVRSKLEFLISLIVDQDYLQQGRYKRIDRLLSLWPEAPSLFWMIMETIDWSKPTCIANLIGYSPLIYSPIFFRLIDSFRRNEGRHLQTEKSKKELKLEAFQMILERLRRECYNDPELCARVIYQILTPLQQQKFKPLNRYNYQNDRGAKLIVFDLSNELIRKTIEFISSYHQKPSLLEKFFDQVTDAIGNDQTFITEFVRLPVADFDLAIQLLEVIKPFGKTGDESLALTEKGVLSITRSLELWFDKTKGSVLDFYDEKPKVRKLKWFSDQHGLSTVNWGALIVWMNQYKVLDEFLIGPKQAFVAPINDTHSEHTEVREFNLALSERIRLKLKILLFATRQIRLVRNKLTNLGHETEEILLILERAIDKMVKQNLKSKEPYSQIFGEFLEEPIADPFKERLFPILAEELNFFEEKRRDSLIEEIVKQSDDLYESTILLEKVQNAKVREKILRLIDQVNVIEMIQKGWGSRVQSILISTLNSGAISGIIESIFERFADSIEHRKNYPEVQLFLFQVKAFIAFQNGDIERLNNLARLTNGSGQTQKAEFYRSYYRGMIFLNLKKSEEALIEFESILTKESTNASAAVGRFFSKLKIAEEEYRNDENEAKKSFQQALDEWELFESQHVLNDVSHLKNDIALDKLMCYNFLNEKSKFEEVWVALDDSAKRKEDFIKLRIDFLRKEGSSKVALSEIDSIEKNNSVPTSHLPEFYTSLKNDILDDQALVELKRDYASIKALPPEKIVKVVHERYDEFEEFLLFEFCGTILDILNQVLIFHSVKDEDKYTSVIQLIINARLEPYKLQFSAQTPSGYSNTKTSKKKKSGYLDLSTRNGLDTIIFEALRYYDYSSKVWDLANSLDHLNKSFSYSAKSSLMFIVIYYEKEDDFSVNWEEYKRSINQLKLPDEIAISNKCLELTDNFGEPKSLRICKTIHAERITVFHLFVNIHYNKLRSEQITQT